MKKILFFFVLCSSVLKAQSIYSNSTGGLVAWWLYGTSTLTDSGGSNWVKAMTDIGIYGNNLSQLNHPLQPTDAGSYLNFTGGNMTCPITTSLKPLQQVTVFVNMYTGTTTSFMGIGPTSFSGNTTGGIGIGQNASQKGEIFCSFSKTNISLPGVTSIDNSTQHKVYATVNCSKLYNNYSLSVGGGEEPSVIKVGSNYIMYYDSAGLGIFAKSANNPYFNGSTITQLTTYNCGYGGIFVWHGTYYLTEVNFTGTSGLGKEDTLILFSSSSPTSGFVRKGVIYSPVVSVNTILADVKMTWVQDSFKCYFSYFTSNGTASTIALCTSKNGTIGTWTYHNTCVPNGGATAFDFTICADACPIINPDSSIVLFYTGDNTTYSKQQQGYATSSDGLTFSKYSGNPIHYGSGQTYETYVYGPNEPAMLYEAGAGAGGLNIWRMWYRSDNTNSPYKIGYSEYNADPSSSNHLPYCGNETIVTTIYVDGSQDATNTISGALGLDYILPTALTSFYLGGDGTHVVRYTGRIYDARIFNKIKTNF